MRISDWSSVVCSSDLTLQELPRVVVDLVGQTRIALRVSRRHIIDADRRSIGQDYALPDNQRAALAERDDAIVAAAQPRAFREQQGPQIGRASCRERVCKSV